MNQEIIINTSLAIQHAKKEIYRKGEIARLENPTMSALIDDYEEYEDLLGTYAGECMARIADLIPHSTLTDSTITFDLPDLDASQITGISTAIMKSVTTYIVMRWMEVYEPQLSAKLKETLIALEKDIKHRVERTNPPIMLPSLPMGGF